MSKNAIGKITAQAPIPWENKPANCPDVVWRSRKNPIIGRHAIPTSNSVYNSAVVPFEGNFAGVFRIDDKRRFPDLYTGRSDDGVNWKIEHDPIEFGFEDKELAKLPRGWRYDPRCTFIDDRFYITWCNSFSDLPTIGIAYTYDFKKYTQIENAFLPFNRNGVLFPRKVNGKYVMLSRPSDRGHTPFGDIYYSESPDLCYWGKHRLVMKPTKFWWENTKIGSGPSPIETDEGWLLIYHGVLNSCNGLVYQAGVAVLDLEKPWVVRYRSQSYILAPEETYECVGNVGNVVFPCATLEDKKTGRLAIYYGAADTVVGLAYAYIDELIDYAKKNSGK